MKKRNSGKTIFQLLVTPFLTVAAVLCLFTAVSNMESTRDSQGRRRLEDTIRRASVTCYAAEGVYPPTVAYLEEHYGLQIDTKRYTVYYDVFAENLMPDITVLENKD